MHISQPYLPQLSAAHKLLYAYLGTSAAQTTVTTTKCSRHPAKLRIDATWQPRMAQSSSPLLKCPLGLGGRNRRGLR